MHAQNCTTLLVMQREISESIHQLHTNMHAQSIHARNIFPHARINRFAQFFFKKSCTFTLTLIIQQQWQ